MNGRYTAPPEHRLSLFVFLGLSVAVGLTFCGIYALLTHPEIHRGLMLALGGYNYENTAAGYAEIRRVMVPYAVPDAVRLLSWDAHTYQRIATEGYSAQNFWMAAFFPWFPGIWGLFHFPVEVLPVLHFSLFSIGMAVLFSTFGTGFRIQDQCALYLACMTIPSFAIMYMPYPEAWSFLFLALSLRAMAKGRFKEIFFWMLLYTTTRPNVLLLGCALLGWGLQVIWHEKQIFTKALRPVLWAVLGVFFGLLLVFGWFAAKTGSFFVFFEAQKVWNTQFQWPIEFRDWSIEMKGLNISLVLLGGGVALLALGKQFFKRAWVMEPGSSIMVWAWWAWFGISLHVLLFQGGNLHSAHRYLVAQPLFVVLVLGVVHRIKKYDHWQKWGIWLLGLGLSAFLVAGLGKIRFFHFFESAPYWWMVIGVMWLLFIQGRWAWYKVLAFGLWCLFGVFYQTFLWNVFLSRGWIWA